jgi:hypothetical protein
MHQTTISARATPLAQGLPMLLRGLFFYIFFICKHKSWSGFPVKTTFQRVIPVDYAYLLVQYSFIRERNNMYYKLETQNQLGQNTDYIGDYTSFARVFRAAESYLRDNQDMEAVITQISEEDLEDIDGNELNDWSSDELRDRQRIIRHLVWHDGVQDA